VKCRKEAIQKTIMAMTLGKDVSALFPDVLKNVATSDLDQKKLVYLYLMYESAGRIIPY
jgi:AP-1 complex subunit beta-1